MSAQPILDGVLGLNKAEVTASNAVKVVQSGGAVAGVGLAGAINAAGLYVENGPQQNVLTGSLQTSASLAVLIATATGTAIVNGPDQVNRDHRGANFYIVATTTVTVTIRLNFQGKDPNSGLYFTLASLSLDGVTSGNGQSVMTIYPGASGGNQNVAGLPLPRDFRVQASLTASTTSVFAPTVTVVAEKIL